jgi:hypothetical protein
MERKNLRWTAYSLKVWLDKGICVSFSSKGYVKDHHIWAIVLLPNRTEFPERGIVSHKWLCNNLKVPGIEVSCDYMSLDHPHQRCRGKRSSKNSPIYSLWSIMRLRIFHTEGSSSNVFSSFSLSLRPRLFYGPSH